MGNLISRTVLSPCHEVAKEFLDNLEHVAGVQKKPTYSRIADKRWLRVLTEIWGGFKKYVEHHKKPEEKERIFFDFLVGIDKMKEVARGAESFTATARMTQVYRTFISPDKGKARAFLNEELESSKSVKSLDSLYTLHRDARWLVTSEFGDSHSYDPLLPNSAWTKIEKKLVVAVQPMYDDFTKTGEYEHIYKNHETRIKAYIHKIEDCDPSQAHSGFYNALSVFDSADSQHDDTYANPLRYEDYRNHQSLSGISGTQNDVFGDSYADRAQYHYSDKYVHSQSLPMMDYNHYRPLNHGAYDGISAPSMTMLLLSVASMVCVFALMIFCILSIGAWIGCYFVMKEKGKKKKSKRSVNHFNNDVERE